MADRIFFDFDGTLIDSSRRLYALFTELVPESTFSYEEYWRIKRNRTNQRDLLHNYFDYTDENICLFKQKWKEQIEEPTRLATDVPFEGVSDLLRKLSRERELYLVTARQYPDRAKAQVHQFGWKALFTDIFFTLQQQSKASLIRATLPSNNADIFVGDTGEDILSGKELGMKTVAVSSGFLSAEVLTQYQPDQLLDSVVTSEGLLMKMCGGSG